MSELTPILSDINQKITPYATQESAARGQSQEAASRWRRFLKNKRKRIQEGYEAGAPGVPRYTYEGADHPLTDWIRKSMQTASRRLRLRRLEADIEDSQAHFQRYVLMAQYAINLAVGQERNPSQRLAKRRDLMNRWRRLYQRPTPPRTY